MSYIYAHKVTADRIEIGGVDQTVLEGLHDGNEVFCRRDGEELSAAASIIDLVDELDNGEALVITRDLF